MSYRIERRADALLFVGHLDAAAVQDLRARCCAPNVARIVLGAGTQAGHESIGELLALGVEVSAESAYLARWLDSVRRSGARP